MSLLQVSLCSRFSLLWSLSTPQDFLNLVLPVHLVADLEAPPCLTATGLHVLMILASFVVPSVDDPPFSSISAANNGFFEMSLNLTWVP